jgi:hypothetical protein
MWKSILKFILKALGEAAAQKALDEIRERQEKGGA